MSILFSPLRLGELTLANRIFMAPLTRCRANHLRIPTPSMRKYYADRASAGLIITEATSVSPMGVGYPNTPGIWSQQQIDAWGDITDAVHQNGGKIILQLWHVGRISDPVYLQNATPLAPSAIAANGYVNLLRPYKHYVVPHELSQEEVHRVINEFTVAAINAKSAKFDGIEIHGANGYLLDQFLQDVSNNRSDNYGGSIENRARFMLEVTDRVVEIWGATRVGMHLSPRGDYNSMGGSNLFETFTYVTKELGKRNLAFICVREPNQDVNLHAHLKTTFGGGYIANQGFTQMTAEKIITSGASDAVAFGKMFISNPDLPQRFFMNYPLMNPDPLTFYVGGENGYNDYSTYC